MSHPDPVLEPAAEQFVRENLLARGVEESRWIVEAVQSGDVPRPDATITDLDIAGGPSGCVSVRLIRPAGVAGDVPVIVYLHGGGWVAGDAGTHDRLVRELATRAGAAVVFVNHTRSPEVRYPVAIEEAYAALEWVAAQGAEQGLDPARVAIAGDSTGGNMCAAVTIMAKQRSGPMIAGQVLFYPVTDAAFDTDSYRRFGTGFWLRRDCVRWFWDQYTTDAAARAEITASPLRATPEDLAGLPPALVIVAEADVLRDEGEAYAARLREAGVPVTAVRYQGVIHDFVMLDALRETEAARAAVSQAGRFLYDALH